FPLRWAKRRRSDRASRCDEQDRQFAVEAYLFLWSRAAARTADNVERQVGKRRRRAACLCAPRKDERARGARPVEIRHGEKSGITRKRVQKAAMMRPFAFIPLRAGSVAIAFVNCCRPDRPPSCKKLEYQRSPALDVPRFIRK